MPPEPDHALLDRWRGGDRAAGEELFGRHFDRLYRFFANKYDGEIDELVQGTFLACLHARDQFRGEASFRTYLFTIARHELYRQLRRRRRDERVDFLTTSVAELVTTPASRLARGDDHRRLVEAMQHLPVEQHALLELHYWEGLEIAELAAIFEAPAATIRTRLHRARKALREAVEAASDEELDALARTAGGPA